MSGLQDKRFASDNSTLPYDIIFKILLLLSAKDLLKLSLVCKTWRTLIHSPNFVQLHTTRCQTVLTFLKRVTESCPGTICIDAKDNQFTLFDPAFSKKGTLQICSMEFNDKSSKITDLNICGFRDILATCDGLVLATHKNGRLVILNPVTRNILPLKSGTIVQHREESYGFVFSHHEREYKAVHLFRDKSGHVDSEILSFKTMSWRGCSVPSSGLFRDLNQKAVAASGVLYWLPGNHNVDYLVSMDVHEGKFVRKGLPVNNSGLNDRLIENGGLLTFVSQMTVYRMQLWTLKRNECEEKWVKMCTINMDYDITGLVPMFMTKNGRSLFFKTFKGGIYEYDMEYEEIEKVLVDGELSFNYKMAFPHMNTLVSWSNPGPLW